jgi:hypothetical protein
MPMFPTRIRHTLNLSADHVSRRAQKPERFWIPIQIYAADGDARPNCGDAPFRQPCPAYPFARRKAAQVRFSEEVSGLYVNVLRKRVSQKAQAANFSARTTARKNRSATTSLDELAEPNNYNKRMQTSSTHVFASHQNQAVKVKNNTALFTEVFPSLMIPARPSTLQAF